MRLYLDEVRSCNRCMCLPVVLAIQVNHLFWFRWRQCTSLPRKWLLTLARCVVKSDFEFDIIVVLNSWSHGILWVSGVQELEVGFSNNKGLKSFWSQNFGTKLYWYMPFCLPGCMSTFDLNYVQLSYLDCVIPLSRQNFKISCTV